MCPPVVHNCMAIAFDERNYCIVRINYFAILIEYLLVLEHGSISLSLPRHSTWIDPYIVGAEVFGWLNNKKRHYTDWLLNVGCGSWYRVSGVITRSARGSQSYGNGI